MSDMVEKRQMDRLRIMNCFRWVSFLVAAIPASVLAATDPACMQRCENSGSNREYCESVCTYKSQVEAGTENSGYHMYLDNESIYEPMKRAQEYRLGQERAKLESERIALERMRIASEREKLQRKGGESTSADVRVPAGVSTNALWRSYLSLISNQKYGEWLTNALPRAGRFDRFFEVVLAPANILSERTLDEIKRSRYAADISFYLASNRNEAVAADGMSADELMKYLKQLEIKFGS